jgi:DNA-binding CsgD family transcriptional regulator
MIGKLSARQMEITKLYSDGLSAKEIAGRLFISYGTVKAHLLEIYRRLGIESYRYPGGAAKVKLARWWWEQTEGKRRG